MFMSSLMHCVHVCVVCLNIIITSLGEGVGCLAFSLFHNVYNVFHYLLSSCHWKAKMYAYGSSCPSALLYFQCCFLIHTYVRPA